MPADKIHIFEQKTVLGRNFYKVRNFKRRFYLWPGFFKVK